MRFMAVAVAVAVAVGLAVVTFSWLIPYNGSTYIPYSSQPGLKYSALQEGVPFPYYSKYTLASCVLVTNPPIPGGACPISLPSTFSPQAMLFDSALWATLSFAVLVAVEYLRNGRLIASRITYQ